MGWARRFGRTLGRRDGTRGCPPQWLVLHLYRLDSEVRAQATQSTKLSSHPSSSSPLNQLQPPAPPSFPLHFAPGSTSVERRLAGLLETKPTAGANVIPLHSHAAALSVGAGVMGGAGMRVLHRICALRSSMASSDTLDPADHRSGVVRAVLPRAEGNLVKRKG